MYSNWRFFYLLFFASGAAGLVYEIVWGRMLVLVFGSTTNSIVAVVSAFLGGLALGNLVLGKWADRQKPAFLIKIYALLELFVGFSAYSTLFLIPKIKDIYYIFTDGREVSIFLLFTKFLLSALIILVPSFLMGGTLPVLVKFIKSKARVSERVVSILYGLNTLGGVAGVLLAAFVLIEIYGLTKTLLLGVIINLLVALSALFYGTKDNNDAKITAFNPGYSGVFTLKEIPIILAVFLSGFVSIAYQILWTRVLTPVVGTVIYAFGTILSVYLLGLALGSLFYSLIRKFVPDKKMLFALSELAIGFFALLSVILLHKMTVSTQWEIFIRIVPATLFIGLTFPAVVALRDDNKNSGKVVGLMYFANTLGAILGGFLASYLFIPAIGTSQSIVFLAGINGVIALLFTGRKKAFALSLIFVLAAFYLTFFKGDRLLPKDLDFKIAEAKIKGFPYFFGEDEVASVFAFKNAKENLEGLLIDGVATTNRVAETRLMVHIPYLLQENPQNTLVIAFGMGNSYRSSLKLGLNTDSVELVPSVPKTSYLFHTDADRFLNDPNGKIYINDGRNSAFLSRKKYDIIVIDPPPPFVTAGSTVLHSKEFYYDLSKILNKKGIVDQWIYYYGSNEDEISMALRSFLDVFPHVLAVQKKYSVGGIFMLGSFEPIDSSKLTQWSKDKIILADLKEVLGNDLGSEEDPLIEIVGTKNDMMKLFQTYPPITDDHPRSEYYLLRHSFAKSTYLVNKDASRFIEKIKKNHRDSLP